MSNDLVNLIELENRAKDMGFNWPDINTIVEQVISECNEIKQVIENDEAESRLQNEIGDLIQSVISLCVFAGFDVEKTLANTSHKFNLRLVALNKLMLAQGLKTLKDESTVKQLKLWQLAKNSVRVDL